MKYMGSKARISKHILPIILKDRKPDQWYYEPFVGGGNMIDKVDGNRYGIDIDYLTIHGLQCIRDNLDILPSTNVIFNEKLYKKCRDGLAWQEIVGYVAYALSYGGKKWGGWCRDGANKRDYVSEAYRNAVKQSPKLEGVTLEQRNYNDLVYYPESIVYCDPPYANTTKYKDSFDHDLFWQWCRNMTELGHKVFISEYNAPDDFECVWSKEIVSSLTKNTGAKKGVEKLFVYKK